eukprot:359913-Chlamydomonas_euryale.AAC.3
MLEHVMSEGRGWPIEGKTNGEQGGGRTRAGSGVYVAGGSGNDSLHNTEAACQRIRNIAMRAARRWAPRMKGERGLPQCLRPRPRSLPQSCSRRRRAQSWERRDLAA